MRAPAAALAIAAGLASAAGGFVACASGSNPPPDPPAPSASPPSTSPPVVTAAVFTPPAPESPSDPPRSRIVNDPPDAGVVLNNAMTSRDAGSTDRFQAMVDVIRANRDGFRRCFDLWSAKNPGVDGKVFLVWSLKSDGTLTGVELDVARSTVQGPDLATCMIDFARKLSYPPSPSGKETRFTYPFDFKHH